MMKQNEKKTELSFKKIRINQCSPSWVLKIITDGPHIPLKCITQFDNMSFEIRLPTLKKRFSERTVSKRTSIFTAKIDTHSREVNSNPTFFR